MALPCLFTVLYHQEGADLSQKGTAPWTLRGRANRKTSRNQSNCWGNLNSSSKKISEYIFVFCGPAQARQRGDPGSSTKPYPCTLCEKEYSAKDNLTIHIADAHTPEEEKPFPCKNCDKKFPSEKLLKMHQRQEGRKIKGRPKVS